MKSTSVALAASLVCALTTSHATTVITYEDANLGSLGYLNDMPYTESGATHGNSFNAMFGSWSGFAISNNTNTTSSSFAPNQYISHAGGAAGGTQFAVGYASSFSRVTFGTAMNLTNLGALITNIRFAALSMQNGDMFAKKFGGVSGNDTDWFLLSVTGLNAGMTTGSTEMYLADFRFADNTQDYILDRWKYLDFSPLGTVDEVRFSLTSSDVGAFGMNTPAYFAMDQLLVPEPSSTTLSMAAAIMLLGRRTRRKE